MNILLVCFQPWLKRSLKVILQNEKRAAQQRRPFGRLLVGFLHFCLFRMEDIDIF